MPMSRGGGLPSATAVTNTSVVTNKPKLDLKPKPIALDPIQKEAIKVIQENDNVSSREKEEKIKEVIEDQPPKIITPKPDSPIAPPPKTPSPFIPPSSISP